MLVGWQTCKIADLLVQNFDSVIVEADRSYRLLGVRLEGRGPFLREEKSGHNISAKTLNLVQSGDFIYSRLFAWRGAFGVVPDEMNGCYVSDEFPTFSINAERLSPKFLQLYFSRPSIWREVEKYCTGTTKASRNRFKELFFLGLEIPLPPLTEQYSIVKRIEALVVRVAEAQCLRKEADGEAVLFINSVVNALINDAQKKNKTLLLEELLKDANYGTSVKCKLERTDNSVPVLRIPNVASEKVSINNLKFGVLGVQEYQKTVLNEGDILVVRTNGSADLVGRCAVVPALPEPMAFASYMIRIRCDKEIIYPEFLQLVLRQQRTGGFLIDFARTTAGQYNVSLGRLRKTRIPVPPLDEQRRLVAYLDGLQAQVSQLRHHQEETQKELDALMPSILDKAFKGEL